MLEAKERTSPYLIGVDEVGRGPLAGDVVACAAYLDLKGKSRAQFFQECLELNVTDSKKLTQTQRRKILEAFEIKLGKTSIESLGPLKIALAIRTPRQIEKENILQASLKAMQKACDQIIEQYLHEENSIEIFIDGNRPFKNLWDDRVELETLIKGDSRSYLIALASIAAKEFRDLQMTRYDKKYPGYQFGKNAGYPTESHRQAIGELGITPIHRKTFKGVREYVGAGA